MDFKDTLFTLKVEIEEELHCIFDTIEAPKRVVEVMKYSIFADGKRIRPSIMLYLGRKLKTDDKQLLPLCCAVEMIHTYSLIHDDLPAMDNDDMRRGKKTSHKVYGEDMAILAGDGLLNFAFETIIKNIPSENNKGYINASAFISACSGVSGMIGGQVLDIQAKTKNLEELQEMHYLKTGKLFEASLLTPVYLAESSDLIISLYKNFSKKLGLLFQITDDILDITSEKSVLGKTTNKDIDAGKVTYVTMLGIDGAMQEADKIYSDCMADLAKIDDNDCFFKDLIKLVRQRIK